MTTFQKLPKNVGELGKLTVAKGFKNLPMSNKLPILVTLLSRQIEYLMNCGRLDRQTSFVKNNTSEGEPRGLFNETDLFHP